MKGLRRIRRRRPWLQRLLVLALTPWTLSGCSATYRSYRVAPGELTGLEAPWMIGGVVTTEGRLLPLDQPPEVKWADIRADTLFGRAAGEPVAIPLAAIDSLWVFQYISGMRIASAQSEGLPPQPPEKRLPTRPKSKAPTLRQVVKVGFLVFILCLPQAFKKHVKR